MTQRGFTLVELMVVLAIVMTLAAIAMPSYTENIKQSKRAEAKAQLLEAAQFMQRLYSQNDSYAQTRAGVAVAVPDALARVPRTAAAGSQNYTISFATPAPTTATFTLQAAPRVGGSMADDKCGTFTLNQAGRRGAADNATGATADSCWK
jgi:type IV pilus assembly protein PilE